MAKNKKKKISNFKYNQRHRILKKLGFVTTDGRTRLDGRRKTIITKAWQTHGEIVNSKNEFSSLKIPKNSKKLFTDLEYKVYKDRVYINKEGANRVYFKNEKVGNLKVLTIVKRGKGQKAITDYVAPMKSIHYVAENLVGRKLKKGQFITAQIKGRAKFRKRFKSMAALEHYISLFQPQQPLDKKLHRNKKEQEKLRQELIDKMSVVSFKI